MRAPRGCREVPLRWRTAPATACAPPASRSPAGRRAGSHGPPHRFGGPARRRQGCWKAPRDSAAKPGTPPAAEAAPSAAPGPGPGYPARALRRPAGAVATGGCSRSMTAFRAQPRRAARPTKRQRGRRFRTAGAAPAGRIRRSRRQRGVHEIDRSLPGGLARLAIAGGAGAAGGPAPFPASPRPPAGRSVPPAAAPRAAARRGARGAARSSRHGHRQLKRRAVTPRRRVCHWQTSSGRSWR